MFGGYLSFAFEHIADVLGATRELAAPAGDELVLMTDISSSDELGGDVALSRRRRVRRAGGGRGARDLGPPRLARRPPTHSAR